MYQYLLLMVIIADQPNIKKQLLLCQEKTDRGPKRGSSESRPILGMFWVLPKSLYKLIFPFSTIFM